MKLSGAKWKLFWLFFIGIIIRLSLLFLDYSFDVNSFMAWASEAAKYGLPGFYNRPSIEVYATPFPNYPPLAIYFFMATKLLYTTVAELLWWLNTHIQVFPSDLIILFEKRAVLAGFMKLPAVAADLGIAWVVYLFAKNHFKLPEKKAIVALVIILFNPVFFYVSGLWGQIDSLPIFFFLASLYILFVLEKPYYTVLLLVAGLLSKQTILVFIPVIGLYIWKKFDTGIFLKSVIVGALLFWLLFLPFYREGNILLFPFITYFQRILFSSGIYFVSNHAFNFWAIITQWQDIKDTSGFLWLTYQAWGYILFAIFFLITIAALLRKKMNRETALAACIIIGYAGFLFLTRIHERHIMPLLPLLLLLRSSDNNQRRLYYLLSFAVFINLYHNWAPPFVAGLTPFVRTGLVRNLGSLTIVGGFIAFYLFTKSRQSDI